MAKFKETIVNVIKVQTGGADCIGVALAGYEGSGGLYGGDLWGRVAAYGAAVVGLCGDDEFDVVHAHDWMTMAAGVALRERTGVPLVVHVHSLEFDRSGSQRGDVFEVERAGMLARQSVAMRTMVADGDAHATRGRP